MEGERQYEHGKASQCLKDWVIWRHTIHLFMKFYRHAFVKFWVMSTIGPLQNLNCIWKILSVIGTLVLYNKKNCLTFPFPCMSSGQNKTQRDPKQLQTRHLKLNLIQFFDILFVSGYKSTIGKNHGALHMCFICFIIYILIFL